MDCIPIRPLPNLVHGPLFFFFFSFFPSSLSSLSFSVSRGPVVYFRFFCPLPTHFFVIFGGKIGKLSQKMAENFSKIGLIQVWFFVIFSEFSLIFLNILVINLIGKIINNWIKIPKKIWNICGLKSGNFSKFFQIFYNYLTDFKWINRVDDAQTKLI